MTVLSDDPIRVFLRDGAWMVDYGTYVHSYFVTRSEAVDAATRAAHVEHRQLVVEVWPRTRRRSQWWSSADPPVTQSVTLEAPGPKQ